MYRGKERGRDNYQMYSPVIAATRVARVSLRENLRAALDRGELELYYQPCLDLATGRIVAMEALLRWQHPEIGLLHPKDFMALADLTGQILAMGLWVLETACKQARAWHGLGARNLAVAVNLSAYELQQPGVVANVERALGDSGLESHFLHLEVPEGYAMQNVERTIETLRALKAVGVGIAIGFGVGFSSLAHLRRLPIEALKMDLSFIRNTTTDPDDVCLINAVMAVAHSLKLKVVTQAVETEEQVSVLRALHCDEVQGYLWSPPVPPRDCERLLTGLGVPAAAVLRGPGKTSKGRGRRGA
jgi:EAL domain-containing protein (putative c-di-GMP-specific phosphodiesterase class I)